MFNRQPKNSLKSIPFVDGRIKCFRRDDERAVLEFIDYNDSEIQIRLFGVSRVLVDEPVDDYEVMSASFYWTGTEWVASFKDDDRQTLLEITYERAEYSV